MKTPSQQMTDFIRQAAGHGKVVPPAAVDADDLKRIEVYTDLGATYAEAREVVIGAAKAARKIPAGNAGTGGGGGIPRRTIDFNDWIRRVAGR